MIVCHIYDDYKECSIHDFYRQIDNEMHLLSSANGRSYVIPELHRNLVHAKAMEIRERAGPFFFYLHINFINQFRANHLKEFYLYTLLI